MNVDVSRPVALVLQNGEQMEYTSLRVLAMSLGMDARRVHRAAVDGRHIDCNGLIFCKVIYTDGFPPDKPGPPPVIQEKSPRIPGRPAQTTPVIISFVDGTERQFESMGEAAEILGTSRDVISGILRRGGRHGRLGYSVRRAN